MDCINQYIIDEEDIAFEYELQRTPLSITTWRRYLENWESQRRPISHLVWLYERFCRQFADKEDTWCDYLRWIIDKHQLNSLTIYQKFIHILEGFSTGCEKFCILMMEFATSEYQLEMIRHILDISLRKLEVGSHWKMWEIVFKFLEEKILPLTELSDSQDEYQDEQEQMETLIHKSLFNREEEQDTPDLWSSHILQRYIKIAPNWNLQNSLQKLASTKNYKAVHALYQRYLSHGSELVATLEIPFSLQVNYLISLDYLQMDKKYASFLQQLQTVFPGHSTEFTIMWAKHEIKRSHFHRVTEILENAMKSTLDFKSFTTIYEFESSFEKLYLENVIEELKANPCLQKDAREKFELSAHLSHLQRLVETHSLRLNDLKLRQNPNSVETWKHRVTLFETFKDKCNVYAEAILSIDPTKVFVPGSLATIWCEYAASYWNAQIFDTAREVWDRALRVPFPHLEDLETIWVSWTEHEIYETGIEKGLQILKTALQVPNSPEEVLENYKRNKKKIPTQAIVFTSLKLWSFYLDLQEASTADQIDLVEKTSLTYETMIHLKVATPMHFIQYAHFLQEHTNDKIKSFQIYERALSLFPREVQYEIWNIYLREAINAIKILSTESIRDLFDQALESLISSEIDCRSIFILYSDFEEKNGLAKRSVDILLTGCRTRIQDSNMWEMCVSKAHRLLGNEASRPYYEECLQRISNSKVAPQARAFAEIETHLGELDRAREILKYGAQFFHPSKNVELWEFWEELELQNGDKESYKAMLKLKRKLEGELSVNTELESQKEGNVQFISASQKKAPLNPEEIDLNI
ncbi:pre-mRNA-splicing factor syf1 [Zygosaccharomyces mellis]|uniref:Pre-mRNA-splicing factor SYF1 n=1 Tax=Zygosaccharomyces mellis TaxID=42258 RepID=A0A4C2E2A2_9SACH|nr:pre-mRNA-splicing factor syf1 [Zygosaccharomyces mellis]